MYVSTNDSINGVFLESSVQALANLCFAYFFKSSFILFDDFAYE